jgi:hypothetical protein
LAAALSGGTAYYSKEKKAAKSENKQEKQFSESGTNFATRIL